MWRIGPFQEWARSNNGEAIASGRGRVIFYASVTKLTPNYLVGNIRPGPAKASSLEESR